MPDIAATGLRAPEGPVVLDDGSIAFVQQELGQASRYVDGRVEEIASGPGAWNSLALGGDGALYGAQNGGVVGEWRASRPATPGVERITMDGTVGQVATAIGGVDALAPNDLAFGPDGRLYLTDPAHPYDPDVRGAGGRLFAIGADASELLLDVGPVYCNGIAFTASGDLVWVESYERTVCMLTAEGTRRVLCELPDEHVPDGMAVAADGRIFIATVTSHGLTVISAEGDVVDFVDLGDAVPTNCCFDGKALWVTDFGPAYFDGDSSGGRLWRVETDAEGIPLHRGALGSR